MKTLWLLRHAKSSWDDDALADHDRPLQPRGKKAARQVGRILAEVECFPERVLCSTAVRAQSTWQLAAAELPAPRAAVAVEFSASLYHAEPAGILAIVQALPEDITSVLLVGHNPGLIEFVQGLTREALKVPTGTLMRLTVPIVQWSQLTPETLVSSPESWRPRA